MTLKRPPWLATILTLAALIVLCGLGTWQIKRLHWKQGIIKDLHAAYDTGALPPLSYEDLKDLAVGQMMFARGTVQGQYDMARTALVEPRTWQGRPGYHILTPLKITGGGTILINRGWIPLADKNSVPVPPGFVTISGLLRRPPPPGPLTPANGGGHWFSIDIAAMTGDAADAVPLVLYAETESGVGVAPLPVREALSWEPANNHAQYAVFWFSMAGILLVIFFLRFVKEPPAALRKSAERLK